MRCPCCGAAELIHDTRDMLYTYKSETTSIPTVTGDFCPACGEVVLTVNMVIVTANWSACSNVR